MPVNDSPLKESVRRLVSTARDLGKPGGTATSMRNAREWQQGGQQAFDQNVKQKGEAQARADLRAKKAKKVGNAGQSFRTDK